MTTTGDLIKKREENLSLRANILAAVRHFFTAQGFLEVETPYRIPEPIPEAHIDPQPSGNWFLHTSPEQCMKRLMARGHQKIFQICRCFRRQERGRYHLPEMTLLEWYSAGDGYRQMMEQCESLICHVAQSVGAGNSLHYQGQRISLERPWRRLTVRKAFERFGSLSVDEALDQDCFDAMLATEIEPHLGIQKPLFLHDYPEALGALARLKPQDPTVAERFELYICGIEICNAFTELIDPQEQRHRFEIEQARRRVAGKKTGPLPENFLTALQQMPPAAGNALGIDRLVMLFADADTIDEVVAFTPEEL